MIDYWHKQTKREPLFPDVIWSKPERRDQVGKLAVIGGSNSGFAVMARAYNTIKNIGSPSIRLIMPDSLRRKIPAALIATVDEIQFTPSNPSGSFSMKSLNYFQAASSWSDNILLIGDSSANSETAGLIETFITNDSESKFTIARDAVDLIINSSEAILNRPKTNLVVSLNQLQKLARSVYYPKIISFSLKIKQIVEILHKFTITYGATITLFWDNHLIVAHSGEVYTMEFSDPLKVWSGEIASAISIWSVWQNDPVKANLAAFLDL